MKIASIIMTASILTTFYGFYVGLNTEYTDCGIIVEKSNRVTTKRKSKLILNEDYFLVKYSDGYVEEIKPTSNDYYYHNINDKICYKRLDYSKERLSMFLILQVYVVLFLVLIITLLFKLID